MTDNGDSMTGGSGPDGDGGALESWLRTEGPKKLPARVLEDGAQFGRFRVLGLLGRGASAEVLRARSEPDGAVVALKVPRDPGDKTAARFRLEAALLASCPHEALPRLVDSGECGSVPWLAMEELRPDELPGRSRDVERLVVALCGALECLHSRGFVHRDVKPGNVMFRSDGSPVLVDLGFAKRIDDGEGAARDAREPLSVESGKVVGFGTPGYAAPEQFTRETLGPAADVYALGMLASRCFDGHIPLSWRPVLRKATAALPADRYPDAAAFARAVRHRRMPLFSLVAALFENLAALASESVAARKRAKNERNRTQGAVEFVRTLLSAANPGNAGGSSRTSVLASAEKALPALKAEPDGAVRAALALETGRLFESAGRLADAENAYGIAADALRNGPSGGGDGADLSETLHRRGVARRLAGKLDDAERDLAEALEMRRAAARRDPAALPGLAATLSAMGALRSFQDRPMDAVSLLRESVNVRRTLAARDPGRHVLALARASSNLGVQLGELGMGEEAISAFDEALPVFRQHAASGAPCDSANYARALAWRADALRRFGEGRVKEALRDFDEAIGILRKLAEDEPGAYRPHLARAVENRALALHDAGDREGALAGLDEALALFEASERAEHGSCAGDIANARRNKRVMIGATGTDA